MQVHHERLGDFVRDDYARVVAVVAFACGDAGRAEDAVQDALAATLLSGTRIDHLRPWVVKVALNHVRSGHRRSGAERRADRRRRRRVASRVLVATAVVAVVAGGALLAFATFGDGDPSTVVAGPSEAPATTLAVPPVGEVRADRLADGTPVWVARHTDGSVSVLDAVSTHDPFGIGQLVGWCGQARGFVDPKHGSEYDERGRRRGGPAPAGLSFYPTAPAGQGEVVVTGPATPQPRADDGGEPATPRSGPECLTEAGYIATAGPGALISHAASRWRSRPLDQAMTSPDGDHVVIRGATIVIEEGRAVVCPGTVEVVHGHPETCRGVDAPDLELIGDYRWVVSTGPFIAEVRGSSLYDIAHVAGSTTRTGTRGGASVRRR